MGLLEDLDKRILIADGAMGTLLYSYGVGRCFEELNLTHTEQIEQIHRDYIAAGAEVIQTNTYAANYVKLARYGLEDHVKKINQTAAGIARKAAGNQAYVLGTIGGIHGTQTMSSDKEEIKRSFREQLYCLLLAGVDGLLLETYYDVEELKTVLQIAREETDIPIIANVSMHEPGVLENGYLLDDALEELRGLGADVTGVNCALGPHHTLKALDFVSMPKKGYLSAYPNASLPAYHDRKLVYENEPDYFQTCAPLFLNQGVRLLGGCCGTTPAHIRAFKAGIKGLTPVTEKEVQQPAPIIEVQKEQKQLPLSEIAKQRHSVIVELDAPRHLDTTSFMQGVKALEKSGVDAITLADNSLATPRISNLAIAAKIKQETSLRPLVHINCRDRNLTGLQSHLLGMHTLGIDEILAITGDPKSIGDFPGATSVFDVTSFELIKLIKQDNNEGRSFSGRSLRKKCQFHIAAACNPNVAKLDRTVQRMQRKIDCGADYFLTQPMYSADKIKALALATTEINKPIYVGIMPLTSYRNAEFLHNEVPGIKLSDDVRQRMQQSGEERDRSAAEGLAIAKELIDTAIQHFHGIYLITPFLRYEMTVELVDYIHEKTEKNSLPAVTAAE